MEIVCRDEVEGDDGMGISLDCWTSAIHSTDGLFTVGTTHGGRQCGQA